MSENQGLKEGDKAPNVSLNDKDGKTHAPLAGGEEYCVLFFYPKDDTPGCTIEAKDFSENLGEFISRRVQVLGISGGSGKSKEKFCNKHGLQVTLLSDPDFEVAGAFGAFGEKKFMGRTFNGIFRKTFIIDRHGLVVAVFDAVKPKGHVAEVLATLDRLRSAIVTCKSPCQ